MMKNKYILLIFFLICALLISGCAAEPQTPIDPDAARNGDIVKLHYTLKLDDGSVVFTSSNAGEPVEITLGAGSMLPAFEKAVIGMKEGEKKTVTIPADEAYGPYRPELVIDVPLSQLQLPDDQEPQVGMQFQATKPDGSVIMATITEVSVDSVKLDTNNRLAGKDLIYEIELIDIL
jgi:peptidylprolyl isomerase